MRCVPNHGGDIRGDLLLGEDTKDDWAGLSPYEERNNRRFDPAQKVHDIISRRPLDIPRSQQKPDINSRICRVLRLTDPSPANAPASEHLLQHRLPRGKDMPDIQVDLHLCRTNRWDSMRPPRRDVYIEYFHPGARYDAAARYCRIFPWKPAISTVLVRAAFSRPQLPCDTAKVPCCATNRLPGECARRRRGNNLNVTAEVIFCGVSP